MGDVWLRIAACVAGTGLFFVASKKMTGAMQQSGYKNGRFFKWLKRRDNLFYNRVVMWVTLALLSSALFAVCFTFSGEEGAAGLSLVPILFFSCVFCVADGKYALKVPCHRTGRVNRLSVFYILITACAAYVFLAILEFIAALAADTLYGCFKYVPFALFPLLLPFLFALTNAILSPFENFRNRKFVKRAGQVLDETDIIRVAVVGSYGKTSVKNILKTVLQEKYAVVATPHSYNTPVGIAKTVTSEEFLKKQLFIAEMGARRIGDIRELCDLVKPDYALFTGVCAQHVESFGSEENVFKGKSEILQAVKQNAVCGAALQPKIEEATWLKSEEKAKCTFVDFENCLSGVELFATKTRFALTLPSGEKISVTTSLLGRHAAENMALVAYMAYALGLNASEIQRGLERVTPIPHRLELIENGGVYILDDSYNSNPRGAAEAIEALGRFSGRKFVVTPGLVETGILEEELGKAFGKMLVGLDEVILIGETQIECVKEGYALGGGETEKLHVFPTLERAQAYLQNKLNIGDCVLFLNDLPDVY